ncbi:hypothetical protein NECAME_15523 [Necator americanus]|uniref:Uncharacterized protein n=1 Tax=Necator americanus TaxID=51031 RepID=W2SJN5_NECAM|nr:hypothetical protein NECAME_15523 [Necator americanus]ETN69101.1 hypothetical protein NECAME_15523 [Necator americanus]
MNAFYKVYYWLFDLCEHALVSALLLATVFFFFLPVLFNLESISEKSSIGLLFRHVYSLKSPHAKQNGTTQTK